MARHNSDETEKASALMLAAIPRLRRFAVAMTGSHADGEDLAQLALERAISSLDRFQPGTRMDSWLFRIAYNAWIDEVRSRKRRGSTLPIEESDNIGGADGRDVAHARLELSATMAAMQDLPDEFRVALTLVAIDGMSYQEAADTLKVPIGTVMSRVSRARKMLVNALEGVGDDAHG